VAPYLFERDRIDVAHGLARGAGVMAIILDPEDRVLLHLRDDKPGIWYPGHWALFGGAIEDDEDATVALHREIDEELGLRLEAPQAFCRVFDRDGSKQVVTIYVAQQNLDVSSIRLNEGADIGLFEPPVTERLRITPFLHDALRAWLRVDRVS
jgi:8-oxo-dGTP diphosphatase